MVEDWISQANARQRRGRAGRVKPGSCFCMYTRHRYDHLMRPFQVFVLFGEDYCRVFFVFSQQFELIIVAIWLLFEIFVKQPEMLRMPLVELCLQIKLLSLGNIRLFLSEVILIFVVWIPELELPFTYISNQHNIFPVLCYLLRLWNLQRKRLSPRLFLCCMRYLYFNRYQERIPLCHSFYSF